jgi:putative ABC transport system ATP-binding protein
MIVKVENLKFKYPNSSCLILDIPAFEMNQGEKIFLYGPSGCGKTTFLEVLAGINTPLEGVVKVNDQNIIELSTSERDQFRSDNMGYIFQSFNLIPYLTVKENITLPLYFSAQKRKRTPVTEENRVTYQLAQFLGIDSLLDKSVTELSVGQQQRVAAARAIIGQPSLILADEPTSALDFNHREKFIKLLFELCNEHQTSVLFVSHDRTLERLFDRALCLHEINRASKDAEDPL